MGKASKSKKQGKNIVSESSRNGFLPYLLAGTLGVTALGTGMFLYHSRGDNYTPQTSQSGTIKSTLDSSQTTLEGKIFKYGKILYEQNPEADNTIYIMGQVHRERDSTGSESTWISQTNIYRIIEAVGLHNGSFPLLIEEGRDAETDYFSDAISERLDQKEVKTVSEFNDESIAKVISSGTNISGASLINSVYGSGYQGWENKDASLQHGKVFSLRDNLRENILNELQKLENNEPVEENNNDGRLFEIMDMHAYLTDYRSLVMLQNLPKVLQREFNKGRLQKQFGVGIIGEDHLGGIIDFLKKGNANIKGVKPIYFLEIGELPSIEKKVDLNGYHVVVIQPNKFLN